VAMLNETGGNWQEKVVVSALRVVPISKQVPDESQARCFNDRLPQSLRRYLLLDGVRPRR
jgi:hypothetical protein